MKSASSGKSLSTRPYYLLDHLLTTAQNQLMLREWTNEHARSSPGSPLGMHNPAQQCYRNGALQLLFNVPHYVNYIRGHEANCCNELQCLECALKDLCVDYWSRDKRPKYVDSEIPLRRSLGIFWERCAAKKWKPKKEMKEQWDAQELMNWILDHTSDLTDL